MSLYWLSWLVVFMNPMSAMMLSVLILRYKALLRLGFLTRLFSAILVVGLLLQTVDHINLLVEYREPRAVNWVFMVLSVNGLIWSLFIRWFLLILHRGD